jgi:hypothetical protein
MKPFEWNLEKNEALKIEREISFETIVYLISNGGLVDILDHFNKDKYPNQEIFVIKHLENYFYVPYVENETNIFLKTIIPSRKLKKLYESKTN